LIGRPDDDFRHQLADFLRPLFIVRRDSPPENLVQLSNQLFVMLGGRWVQANDLLRLRLRLHFYE